MNIKMMVVVMLGLWVMIVSPAHAGLVLGKTRIIYHQSDRVQNISLQNSGSDVYLIQAAVTPWGSSTSHSSVFIVLPPLFRIEGNSSNVMRIIRTGGDFPTDRESLYSFRINAIPARGMPTGEGEANKQQEGVAASLSISLGMNIKFIYRPDGLSVTPKQAYARLTFTRTGNTVVVTNPTPYYQTFAQLKLDGEKVDLNKNPSMLAPFDQATFSLTGLAGNSGGKVTWSMITDAGGVSELQSGTLHTH
ncbi:fimbrial biogenesis chaperone [Photorhabdus antumapuensis]|uniref:fimbrial biogenesis chaperone n=1 Tax=Photorhabdus antumapuensis TaxID=2862867 RepID=UPI001CECB59B|nr:molecular chaperone [Photorhabdus antumapuensis]